jgi:hypothetical protein
MSPLQQRAAAARASLAAAAMPADEAVQLRYRASRFRTVNGVEPGAAARERAAEERARAGFGLRKQRDGRASGWRKGTPQCPGCRRILSQRDGYCPSCGTVAGRHDHGR